MPLTQSERNRNWRTKYPETHKDCYENWRVDNKEKRNEYARKWHAEQRASDPVGHAKKVRKAALKRKYKITPEDYENMLAAQGGHCALCDRTPDQERHKYLNVDHCHETGKVRGLLCTPHNHAFGKFGDNEAGLLMALAYIRGGI